MAINVLLVDDDKLITESMKMIFEFDDRLCVVATASNGQEALDICVEKQVDVALVDIRMPEVNGIWATKEIVLKTQTKVLILTTFDEDEYIKKCFEYGAKGYLLKTNTPEVIKNAIISVYGGNSVVEEKVMQKMVLDENDKDIRIKHLTNREKDIVKSISTGMTNKEIASEFFISEGTVKNTITSILTKLNLKHRTQIAIYYLQG